MIKSILFILFFHISSHTLLGQVGTYKQISRFDNSNRYIIITQDSSGHYFANNLNSYMTHSTEPCKAELLIDTKTNKITIITFGFESGYYLFEMSGKGNVMIDGSIQLTITVREYENLTVNSQIVHTYVKID